MSEQVTAESVKKIIDEAIDSKTGRWKAGAAGIGVFTVIFAIMGLSWADFRHFLFEKLYPPEVVYKELKKSLHEDQELRNLVASDIIKLIGARVDSGYSKTLYFGPSQKTQAGQDLLQFHALPTQRVELTLRAHSSKSNGEFVVLVDNKNLFESVGSSNPRFDLDMPARDITNFFEYKPPTELDSELEKKQKRMFIHTLRVTPVELKNEEASFEILVLVRNEKT
jgi:hypothetical protein